MRRRSTHWRLPFTPTFTLTLTLHSPPPATLTFVVILACIAIAVAAYFLGSIPMGYLLVRVFRRQDIRSVGSGNIGATNVLRFGGKGLGAATFLLDVLKGSAAVWLGAALGAWLMPAPRCVMRKPSQRCSPCSDTCSPAGCISMAARAWPPDSVSSSSLRPGRRWLPSAFLPWCWRSPAMSRWVLSWGRLSFRSSRGFSRPARTRPLVRGRVRHCFTHRRQAPYEHPPPDRRHRSPRGAEKHRMSRIAVLVPAPGEPPSRSRSTAAAGTRSRSGRTAPSSLSRSSTPGKTRNSFPDFPSPKASP